MVSINNNDVLTLFLLLVSSSTGFCIFLVMSQRLVHTAAKERKKVKKKTPEGPAGRYKPTLRCLWLADRCEWRHLTENGFIVGLGPKKKKKTKLTLKSDKWIVSLLCKPTIKTWIIYETCGKKSFVLFYNLVMFDLYLTHSIFQTKKNKVVWLKSKVSKVIKYKWSK